MEWLRFLLILLLVLLFVQIVIWYNNYRGPVLKRRLQNQKPLSDLGQAGFKPIDDAYAGEDPVLARERLAYLGQVAGYWVDMTYDWRSGWSRRPYFRVRVFYSAGNGSSVADMQDTTERKRLQSKFFRCADDTELKDGYATSIEYSDRYSYATAKSLLDKAERLVKELQMLELTPIDYQAGAKLAAQCHATKASH